MQTIAAPRSDQRDAAVVWILLATFQGGAYLRDQLKSIEDQQGVRWRLLVSDDGSTDATRAILDEFAKRLPDPDMITVMDGPGQGAAANFRHLLSALPDGVEYAAFCDQDDVWRPQKLARAVQALRDVPADLPALYCARTLICDVDLRTIGRSPGLRKPPSFRNALVQNIASGNTMAFNGAGVALLKAADAEAGPVVVHDWWAYQLVTGVGGRVIFDDQPEVLYRQHGANEIGAQIGIRAIYPRVRRLLFDKLRDSNRINARALADSVHRLTPANREVLAQFRILLGPNRRERLASLRRGGFYRQSRASQAALWLAAFMGKL